MLRGWFKPDFILEIPLPSHLQLNAGSLRNLHRYGDTFRFYNTPNEHEILAGLRANLEILQVEIVRYNGVRPLRLPALLAIYIVHNGIGFVYTKGARGRVETTDTWLYRYHVGVGLRHICVTNAPEKE